MAFVRVPNQDNCPLILNTEKDRDDLSANGREPLPIAKFPIQRCQSSGVGHRAAAARPFVGLHELNYCSSANHADSFPLPDVGCEMSVASCHRASCQQPANPTRPTPLPASRRRFHPLTLKGGEAEGRVKATVRGGKPALSPSQIPSPTATERHRTVCDTGPMAAPHRSRHRCCYHHLPNPPKHLAPSTWPQAPRTRATSRLDRGPRATWQPRLGSPCPWCR